jgi:hypothetical protein
MNYSQLKVLASSKHIMIKDITERMGFSRQGLQSALDNETISVRKIKLLSQILDVLPSVFFDSPNLGNVMINGGTMQVGNGNKISKEDQNYENEITYLKQIIKDKEEIIRLMSQKK